MIAPENLAAARRVKQKLAERYAGSSWLRGIGLAPRGDKLAVRLNVATGEKDGAPDLPDEVDGVPVEVVFTAGYAPRTDG